jgi:nucleoside-diphosphate-sugar epimerase
MHALIVGAAGMIGRKLVARLIADGQIGGRPITCLTLFDIAAPEAPEGAPFDIRRLGGDLSIPGQAERLVATRPDIIFHLAAIVSGEAESDFELGYRVNLDGTRALLEGVRRSARAIALASCSPRRSRSSARPSRRAASTTPST